MLPLVLAVALASAPDACHGEDERGQRFTTCFDPWTGVEVGGGAGVQGGGGSGLLVAGLRYRGERDSKFKVGSTWLLAHRLGATELRWSGGLPALTVTAYEGYFRRHVPEGMLVLSTNPPRKLPFPFDVALAGSVARYERRLEDGADWSLETARVTAMFDPLRSPSGRFHLGFGPSAALRLRSDGKTVTMDLTPLTALALFFNLESDDGLWVLRGNALAGWTVAPEAAAKLTFRARGELEASRVLVALNDQPISVFVRASGASLDAGSLPRSEWSASVGLMVRLFSER